MNSEDQFIATGKIVKVIGVVLALASAVSMVAIVIGGGGFGSVVALAFGVVLGSHRP